MDYVAIPFIVLALWALGKRYRWGFICQVIGSLMFVIAAAETAMWGFVVANAIFALLAIKGWYSWKPKAEEPAALPETDSKFVLRQVSCNRQYCPHCFPENFYRPKEDGLYTAPEDGLYTAPIPRGTGVGYPDNYLPHTISQGVQS